MSDRQQFESDSFDKGIKELSDRDSDLAGVIDRYGYPNQWHRKLGFATLIQIILEQQVSYASAKATFKRLNDALEDLTPESFSTLDDDRLKAIGFSRQKTKYGRGLAQSVIDGTLNLASLTTLDDAEIRKELTKIKGIGDWTVDIYLMMALQRQDVFPSKDLAVAIAVKEIKNLPARPTKSELESIARAWQPYRAIATKILWHYYLNRKPASKSQITAN